MALLLTMLLKLLLFGLSHCELANTTYTPPPYNCQGLTYLNQISTPLTGQSVNVTSPFLLYIHNNISSVFKVLTSGMVQFVQSTGN